MTNLKLRINTIFPSIYFIYNKKYMEELFMMKAEDVSLDVFGSGFSSLDIVILVVLALIVIFLIYRHHKLNKKD